MKLRSESRTAVATETPIPFMLPVTQAITISNASSPLLRLPQELKDRIYHFVYGGFYVDAENVCNYNDLKSRLAPYAALPYPRRKYGLPVASLGTCRQMYHDVKNLLYSANDFEISHPQLVGLFVRRLDEVSYRSLAVRSVHLRVYVPDKNKERHWDNAFCALTEDLKNLRHIKIGVSEEIWNNYSSFPRRQSPAHGKTPFLRGLLEFKKLPLKTVELAVTERLTGNWGHRVGEDAYIWTAAQKREWAQKMKNAILGTD